MRIRMITLPLLLATSLFSACSSDSPKPVPEADAPPARPASTVWTEELAHIALQSKNPDYNGRAAFRIEAGRVIAMQLSGSGVTDLSPLKGMGVEGLDLRETEVTDLVPLKGLPLTRLYLEQTRVTDLRPLAGMQLVELYLGKTGVSDLESLRGMPLESLNMLGTSVRSLEPLKGMPLKLLWLNETPVTDISPLAHCPLVSLTLHRTQVSDLSPLTGIKTLQRLHVGETSVTDLRPIAGLRLSRLIFTHDRIEEGLEEVRSMKSLREIGPTFERRYPPADYWRQMDQ
jgi:internalin A